MARTFVVGLDGASWLLLEPWIEAGELPNLEQLRNEGSWATSRSCLPPVTFPNWKCYSSGKNPGKFGVYWFERVDLAGPSIDIVDGRDFHTAELWDYLNADGFSTGVINMPTMYPPRKIDGPIVCGGPDAVDGEYRTIESGYTTPAGLEAYLEDEYGYQVHPEPLLSSKEERGAEVDAILELIELRFEVAVDLFEQESLDFTHVTLFYLNVLQHFFWDGNPTKRAWKLIDEWIGRLDELEDTNLVLMSDHGSGPTTIEFYINEWLAANGYLRKKRTPEDVLKAIGITRESVLSLAKQFGLVSFLEDVVPQRLQRLVPQEAGAKRGRKLAKIILSETQAVGSGQGPIYLNPSADTDKVLEALIRDLDTVADSDGQPLFDDVHPGEEIYDGPYVDSAPDIVLDQRPGVHVNDGIGGSQVLTKPDRWEAENTKTGIFVAKGPDFESKGHSAEIEITDIAPTLLASFDIPIPSDVDGEILPILDGDHDSIGTQSPIDVSHRDSCSTDQIVADRLQQLGYME